MKEKTVEKEIGFLLSCWCCSDTKIMIQKHYQKILKTHEKQYISMCQNVYTKKVLAATNDDPIYANGQLVQGRKTAPKQICNKLCTVVASNDRPVTSAAKGSKTYLVLPVGEASPIECEERHLKNFKKQT